MVRALWTGASGMNAQQVSLDNIANNLANVNTTGYKKQTTEFSSLLYQKLQRKQTDNNGEPKPVIAQVGTGVRVTALTSIFTQGIMQETGRKNDFCIEGEGMFRVQMPDGTECYTRNGAFQMSMDGDGVTLCTAEGYPVLDSNGDIIHFSSADYDVNNLTTDQYGRFSYRDVELDEIVDLNIRIGLAQFNNPSGLDKLSDSYYRESPNSGEPRYEIEDPSLTISKIHAQYLEGSNVQTVDEIVNLITTQRAYEMNSKIISAADEMMQQANNLR
ncbi:MAG: flagellar hook-basal body protein [Lachnospiraceae bacterium]|nr:flagellar hook-basal body protein [Lachnospiraceae bacterium]